MKIGCSEVPKPTYPSLLWPAEWKVPAPLALNWHFCQALPAHLVPCWWVGWWFLGAGCISQYTYLLYIIYIFRQLYHKRNKESEGKTLLRKRKYLCKSLSTFSVWRFRDHFVKVWASPAAKDGHKTLQNSCTEAKIWIFSRLLTSSKKNSPEESIFLWAVNLILKMEMRRAELT